MVKKKISSPCRESNPDRYAYMIPCLFGTLYEKMIMNSEWKLRLLKFQDSVFLYHQTLHKTR